MGWDSILSGITKNLPLILDVGSKVGNSIIDRNEGKDQESVIRQQIQADYDRQKAEYDAINEYNNQYAQWAAGEAAARNAAAARAAAVARQNEKNRVKGVKKSGKVMNKTYKTLQDLYAPFKDTTLRLLPQKENAFSGGLASLLGMQSQVGQDAAANREQRSKTPRFSFV